MACDCDKPEICGCEGMELSSACVYIVLEDSLGNLNIISGTSLTDALIKVDEAYAALVLQVEEFTEASIFALITEDENTKQVDIDGRVNIKDGSATAKKGDIRYNATTNQHQGYNGSWNDMY